MKGVSGNGRLSAVVEVGGVELVGGVGVGAVVKAGVVVYVTDDAGVGAGAVCISLAIVPWRP